MNLLDRHMDCTIDTYMQSDTHASQVTFSSILSPGWKAKGRMEGEKREGKQLSLFPLAGCWLLAAGKRKSSYSGYNCHFWSLSLLTYFLGRIVERRLS